MLRQNPDETPKGKKFMTTAVIGIPLQPSNARKIILDLFNQQSQWNRSDLVKEVLIRHLNSGGAEGTQSPEMVVKKCLGVLRQEERVEPVAKGVWLRLDPSTKIDLDRNVQPKAMPALDMASVEEVADLDDEDEETPTSEQITIGQGEEAVYLYFNPNDRELAQFRGIDCWECKIGRTSHLPVDTRIFSQGIKTALSKMPVIALVILTDNCVLTEREIHSALRHVGAEAPDSPGMEWFLTNPKRIAAWYEAYSRNLLLLSQ